MHRPVILYDRVARLWMHANFSRVANLVTTRLAWLSLALLSPAAYVHCLCAHVSYWLMLLVREPEEEVITWYVVGYSWIRVLEFGIISHKNLGR